MGARSQFYLSVIVPREQRRSRVKFYVEARNAVSVLSYRHFGDLSARAKSDSDRDLVAGIWA